MKALIAMVSLLVVTLNATAKDIEKFTCGGMGHGTAFEVQFDGPRYADRLSLSYIDEDIKKLLMKTEQSLDLGGSSIDIAFMTGSCQKGSGDVLVSCEHKQRIEGAVNGWTIPRLRFSVGQDLPDGFRQHVTFDRPFVVNSLKLVVNKVGTDAVMSLSMNVDTPDQKGVNVQIDKKLATLEHSWYMCKYN